MPDEPGGSRRDRHTGWQQGFRDAGPYLGLGMQLAMTMALFTIGGYFLDRWLETLPWLTIIGAVLGMVAIFVHLVRVSNELRRSDRAHGARPARQEGPSGMMHGPVATQVESSPLSLHTTGSHGSAELIDSGAGKGDLDEDLGILQREFARKGEVRNGALLLQAWDALDMIEVARKGYMPVLLVKTFVLTDSEARHIDTLDLSAGGFSGDSWYEASRFIGGLKDSGLYFEVVFGESI